MISNQPFSHNLPNYLTAFVGRNNELNEMRDILEDKTCRLLTLVGPGGSGKTRLAIQLATIKLKDFVDGVFFVPFSSTTDNANVISLIANTIGFQFYENESLKQQMMDYLQEKQMLLLLDSFEDLLDETELIAELLETTTDIKIVVTSREALNLEGECTYNVKGLRIPENKQIQRIEDYGALHLFQDRARRVRADFSIMDTLAPAIQICKLVEGIPLGIELATSWLKVLTCEDIAQEIKRNTDFLATKLKNTPERHQSIRAVFNQSWRLLKENERVAFAKLAVFQSGFTRDAAEKIAGAGLNILASLIDKSLIYQNTFGKYEVHELLRQYANEQLAELGKEREVREAHSQYYMEFLEQRLGDLKGQRQQSTIEELNANFGNITLAWNYAVETKNDVALRRGLETLVVLFWDRYKGRSAEFVEMLNTALNEFSADKSNPDSIWWLLAARAVDYADYAVTREVLEACLETAITNQNRQEVAFCLSELGELLSRTNNYSESVDFFEQSLSYYRELGDQYHIARTLFNIANWKWYFGDREQITKAIRESIVIRQKIGDRIGLAWSFGLLASEEILRGTFDKAEQHFREMNNIHLEVKNIGALALGKSWLGLEIYFMRGDFENSKLLAQEVLDTAPDDNYPLASGYAFATLGMIASMEGDYTKAYQLCTEAHSITSWPDLLEVANWGLSVAAAGLGNFQQAREFIQSVIQYSIAVASPAWIIWCLPSVSLILHNEGEKLKAVEMLALASTHPIGVGEWFTNWPLLKSLPDRLKGELGSAEYDEAWNRGSSFTIEDAMIILRLHFLDKGNTPTVTANQMMIEPLTERELEVLPLIDDGLSNQEIAERLVVSEGTVKKHINHIYRKLDVTGRTQALARARLLRLL